MLLHEIDCCVVQEVRTLGCVTAVVLLLGPKQPAVCLVELPGSCTRPLEAVLGLWRGRIGKHHSSLRPPHTADPLAVSFQCNTAYQCLLIADQHCRTRKYFLCLASGIPCVSHVWVHDSCHANQLQNYRNYLLPAGYSLEEQRILDW